MNTCSCGQLVDERSTQCPRCQGLQVLGLEAEATESEIRRAYRLLAKTWQPERFQGDEKLKEAAAEKLKEITTAFEYLTSTSIERGQGQRPVNAAPFKSLEETPPEAEAAPAEAATASAAPAAAVPAAVPDAIPAEQPGQKSEPFSRRTGWFLGIAALACVLLAGKLIWTFLEAHNADSGQVATAGDSGKESAPAGAPQAAPQAAPQTAPQAAQPAPRSANGRQPARSQAATRQSAPAPPVVQSFITAGSTRAEVLAQQGPPTASTEDKLVYGKSELYLKDGVVIGWRIDPVSSPIRVKLWPQTPVDPRLDFFYYGSSKDSVLALQGTPTGFSENKFEYGGSVVYFQNNRVVSWRIDPASVPLRIRPY
jgi:hypothetical protein